MNQIAGIRRQAPDIVQKLTFAACKRTTICPTFATGAGDFHHSYAKVDEIAICLHQIKAI
jgi:hypothetical protein